VTSGPVTAVRLVAAGLLCGYVLLISAVLLSADQSLPTDVIARTEEALRERGAPDWMTWGDRVQMMLNAFMFAPITALASLAFPRQAWGNWVAYAFLASGAVEVVQAFALEPRSAEYVDVVANTLGGLMGAVLVLPVTAWMRAVSDRRSP
jgi:VanZ family protein